MAGVLKGKKSSGRRLHEIQHRPLVGQQVPQLALPDSGLGQQPNHVGQLAQVIQKRPIELLGVDYIKHPIIALKKIQFFIHGPGIKLIPSLEFLLGLFGVLYHFFLLWGPWSPGKISAASVCAAVFLAANQNTQM